MARKSKAADTQPVNGDASSEKGTTHTNLKRKVNWAAFDKRGGFTLKAVAIRTPKESDKPSHKKQKTDTQASGAGDGDEDASLKAHIMQKNPYPETELSEIQCKVEPAAEWESTKRYRKLTISEEEFEVGQIVFVQKVENDDDNNTPGAILQWFAKILEVRAANPSHVYLRVFWAYRPEDMPGGRQTHHGESELIVSNHMDIIEALSVNGVADVMHWDDDPEKSDWPAKDQLFWRQSLDINKPKGRQITKLRTYCVDQAPCNPDEPLVHCASCNAWLHAHCLEDQAIQEAATKDEASQQDTPTEKGRLKKAAETSENESSIPAAFIAKLRTSASGKIRLTVTDKRDGQKNRRWDVDVKCLICNNLIEKKASKGSPQEHHPKASTANGQDEDEDENDGVTVTTTPSTSKAPMQNSEEDLAVDRDNDEDVENKDAPASDPAEPVPTASSATTAQGRGRSLESTKKRKRAVTRTSTSVAEVTPAPAPASESVIQSGIRSVKRLLWKTT